MIILPKENRQRNIQIHFRVNARERDLIYRKMEQAGIRDTNAYLLKMAIDGYVIYADMSDVKELVALLRRSGANVNQIARRANEMHSIYAEDVADLERHYGTLLDGLNRLLKKWNEL